MWTGAIFFSVMKHWFIQAQFNSFTRYLVSAYYILGIVLNSEDLRMDKADTIPALTKLPSCGDKGIPSAFIRGVHDTGVLEGSQTWRTRRTRRREKCLGRMVCEDLGENGWQVLETEKFTIFGMIQWQQERWCQRKKGPDHERPHNPRRGTGLGPKSSEESWKGIKHRIGKIMSGF